MNPLLTHFQKNKLFLQSSAIVLIGSTLVNLINYTFNLVMSRMLTPAEFGTIATLLGLLAIVSVPATSITTFISKYVARFNQSGEKAKIVQLYRQIGRYALYGGLGIMLLFVLLTPILAAAFKISVTPIILFSLALPLALLLSVNVGLLQGLQRFTSYVSINIFFTVSKIIAAIILVWLGYAVNGVMTALIVSHALAYIVGLMIVRWYIGNSTKSDTPVAFSPHELWQMIGVILAATLAIALYNNIDIILVKLFLSADDAGLYSGMSVMGRVVTYSALSIVTVMVPLVSASSTSAQQNGRLLGLSLAGVSVLTLPVVVFFALFPHLAIHLLVGSQYLEISPLVGWYGLGMYFFTVATVLVQYFVASHQQKFIYPLAISLVILISTLSAFHESLRSITFAYVASGIILFGSLAGTYYFSRPA